MPSSNRPRPVYRRRRQQRSRAPLGVAATALVLAAMVMLGMLYFDGPADAAPKKGSATAPVATESGTDATAETAAQGEAQMAHVTFGAHTQATQACITCHPDEPTGEIACRACHGTACGKDAKTASDCLKCHKTGTTQTWMPAE